jgi:hypothetical protein
MVGHCMECETELEWEENYEFVEVVNVREAK